MASLLNTYHNAMSDSDTRRRVIGACLLAAQAIINEPAGTANHANRLAWASKVLQNPDGYTDVLFRYLLGTPGLPDDLETLTDESITTAVNNQVNAIANYYAAQGV